jgi:signal transduction histidine kinase
MRFATKSTLTLLVVYLGLLGGLALWLDYQLRTMADTLMEGTARLVGREIATAMSESALDQLLHADPSARARLEQIVANLTARSDVVASIAVVDDTGTVVVSDDIDAGRQLAIPQVIFRGNKGVRFLSSRVPLQGGRYHLFVPLVREGNIAGYIRLSLNSTRMVKLYRGAQRQLLMAAGAGLAVVVALGLLFRVQLSRRSAALARALEGAVRGEVVPLRRGRDEFAQALNAARKVGEELNQAREQTSDAQRRFEALMKVMDVGVLLLGRDQSLDFANVPARELLGCRTADDLERRWNAICPQLTRPLNGAGARGTHADVDVPTNGRTAHLRFEIYPRDDGRQEGHLVLVKDRETVDALENELRLAIQMRGFARFSMAFAHDLKAPLNAMVLNLELLKGTLARPGAADVDAAEVRRTRYVAVLGEELARLDRYLRTMLTQTAPPSEAQQEFDLRELVEDLATLLGPQAKQQHVHLEAQLPPEPVRLHGHRDHLKQAMLNIAINALESMPEGGRLDISLGLDAGRARIAVRDSGPGIPPELLGKIYGMHFTTKAGGTGIGLYVARSVVESHGGEIHVDSDRRRGTCFQVELPV